MNRAGNLQSGIFYVYLIAFSISAIMGVLIPLIPIYALELGASQVELGLIGSVGAIVYAASSFTLSGLWDVTGGKTPVVLSCATYASICFLTSLAWSPLILIALRTVEGFALSMLWPPLESYIAESHSSDRGDAVSNYSLSWSSGNVFGTLLSGFALDTVKSSIVFQTAALGAVLVAVIAILKIAKPEKSNRRFQDAKLNFKEMKNILRGLKKSWFSMIVYALGEGMLLALFPAYAKIKGVPGIFIGLSTFLLMTGRMIGFWAFKKIHLNRHNLLELGTSLMGCGSLVFVFSLDLPLIFTSALAVGFGASLLYSTTFESITTISGSQRCFYMGIFEGCIGIGYLTPIVGGVLAEAYLTAPYLLSSIVALAFLLLLFIHRENL